MSQYTESLFVGIDAHQESLSIAVLPAEAAAPQPVRELPNDPARIRRYFRGLAKRGPIRAVYGTGSPVFVLHRQLTSLGIDCTVAAPSRIPRMPGDHRKTDRLDAERLALFLRGHQLTAVSPPTPELEALQSLMRLRLAVQEDVVRARHWLQKFLLLRGHVVRETGNWSAAHMRWLSELRLELGEDQLTCDFLRVELDARVGSLKVLDERIARRAQEPDVHAQVVARPCSAFPIGAGWRWVVRAKPGVRGAPGLAPKDGSTADRAPLGEAAEWTGIGAELACVAALAAGRQPPVEVP